MKLVLKSNRQKATVSESCRTWNFVLRVQATTENVHCGLAIYQVRALDKQPAKLEN